MFYRYYLQPDDRKFTAMILQHNKLFVAECLDDYCSYCADTTSGMVCRACVEGYGLNADTQSCEGTFS